MNKGNLLTLAQEMEVTVGYLQDVVGILESHTKVWDSILLLAQKASENPHTRVTLENLYLGEDVSKLLGVMFGKGVIGLDVYIMEGKRYRLRVHDAYIEYVECRQAFEKFVNGDEYGNLYASWDLSQEAYEKASQEQNSCKKEITPETDHELTGVPAKYRPGGEMFEEVAG